MKKLIHNEIYTEIIKKEQELNKSFDNYSLLINSVSVAKECYENREEDIQLDTMGNFPNEFRTAVEIIRPIRKQEFLEYYNTGAVNIISSDYFVKTVSLLDALLENMYEIFLREDKSLTDKAIDEKVQFGIKGLPNVLLDYFTNYEKHEGLKHVNLKDYFLQYNLYRQLRHAIVHNNGNIGTRHRKRIKNIFKEIENTKKVDGKVNFSTFPFVNNDKVETNLTLIMAMEKFRKELLAVLIVLARELKENRL